MCVRDVTCVIMRVCMYVCLLHDCVWGCVMGCSRCVRVWRCIMCVWLCNCVIVWRACEYGCCVCVCVALRCAGMLRAWWCASSCWCMRRVHVCMFGRVRVVCSIVWRYVCGWLCVYMHACICVRYARGFGYVRVFIRTVCYCDVLMCDVR